MIFWTNFLNKFQMLQMGLFLLLSIVLLAAPAATASEIQESSNTSALVVYGTDAQQPLPLAYTALDPSALSPQPALHKTIRWSATTSGGVGKIEYEFLTVKNGVEITRQKGLSPHWDWNPHKTGVYLVKVSARDELDHIVESDWSEPFLVTPAVTTDTLIAFLPIENLSGVRAPIDEIAAGYIDRLREMGMHLLSEQRLKVFMKRHRMRHTGGIGARMAQALRDEEGVAAVVITSLESYMDGKVPQMAFTSRLVMCHDVPRIAWIDGVGMTGLDSPGLLGLKQIRSINQLQEKAFTMLLSSLDDYLVGRWDERVRVKRSMRPRDHYRASDFNAENPYRVAVVPFLNTYARSKAGSVVPLHLVNILNRHENLEVVEPGLVRESLLKYRMIMHAGPSLAVADVLSSKNVLDADLILSGYVFDYQDQEGVPKIDFSTRVFSGPDREIIWWSRSYATGDDGVFFFDVGRIRSTHQLMQQMSQSISGLLFQH